MKLPVFKAFGATVGLVTGRFATLVEIAWLPMLVMSGVTAWLLLNLIPTLTNLLSLSEQSRPEDVAAALSPFVLPMFVVFAVALVFMPMLFAGLLRYIVRGERPSSHFYLHFGGDELKVLGTYVGIVLINLGVALLLTIVGALLVSMSGGKGAPAGALVERLIDLAARGAELYIALLLSLAFPAAIGYRAVGVGPSWQLTKGNLWRLFGYWALWYAVLALAVGLCALPFLSSIGAFARELQAVAGNDAAAKAFFIEKVRALGAWVAANGTTVWLVAAAHYAISLIVTIVQVAAAGVAYRLIKAEGADAVA